MAQPALGFYVRASSPQVTPRTAGYDYGAKWGIAPAGLAPASTAVSLAALPPVGPVGRGSPPSSVLCAAKTTPCPSRVASLVARFPIPRLLHGVRGVLIGLVAWVKPPDHARACGHPVPQSGRC